MKPQIIKTGEGCGTKSKIVLIVNSKGIRQAQHA
jgi:hypothetical protein